MNPVISKPSRTLRTKHGRLTGQQLIRARFHETLDDWLTPQALHYIFTRTPAVDHYDRPIYDPEFENLVRWHPQSARNQLIGEANAFFAALPERDRKRADFADQQRQQAREVIATVVAKRRRKNVQPPTIPGL